MPDANAPVAFPEAFAAEDRRQPEEAAGLCLSGGGYRAMLFHLGTLKRLNEFGWLPKLSRISSVSGGSITSALLGLRWASMDWRAGVAADFDAQVVEPIRELARHTIDVGSVIWGTVIPGGDVSRKIQKAYRKHLYGDASLQDLVEEGPGRPRFVINATNVQSGAIWRFARAYMADWRVGEVRNPTIKLGLAVTASSAFPPVLSPCHMELDEGVVQPTPGADLHRPPFTTHIELTDGGVYDNLGLETVWKRYRTVIVSDGGGQMAPEENPADDWARHALRINGLIDNQVRSLRKRQVVDSLVRGERRGTYFRTRSKMADFSAPNTLPCPPARTLELAQVPTRLAKLDDDLQERLINWGYALCDAAMRTWVDTALPAPAAFPYPQARV